MCVGKRMTQYDTEDISIAATLILWTICMVIFGMWLSDRKWYKEVQEHSVPITADLYDVEYYSQCVGESEADDREAPVRCMNKVISVVTQQ